MGSYKQMALEEQDREDKEAEKFPPCEQCGHHEHPKDRNPEFPRLCNGCAHFAEKARDE